MLFLRKGDLEDFLKSAGKDKGIKYFSWIDRIKIYCIIHMWYIASWLLFFMVFYGYCYLLLPQVI